MAAYEVDTEDLVGIGDQLAAQAERLTSTTAGVGGATTTMLAEVTTSLDEARTTIDGVLADLAASVGAATAAAEGADWLGPDAELFRDANTELAAVIFRSREQLDTALTEHGTARTQLGQALQGTLDLFTAATSRSAELTAQLGLAVGSEAESYEAAFAGGLGVAGVAGAAVAGGTVAAAGGQGPEDWEGIGETDREWHQWERNRQYRNGRGEDPVGSQVGIDPLAEHTFIDENPQAEHGVARGAFGDEAGLNGNGQLTAARAEANIEAKAGLTTEGGFVSGAVGASAAVGTARGHLGYGPVSVDAQGYVLGAEASAEARAGIGPKGASASFGAEAFAGGKAEAEISGEYGGVTAGVGGEVSYGIGAHAEVDGSFTTDRVGVSVDVGATLGVGAGVKFDVSVDPGEVLDSVTDLFD